jgi:hypothetical protein
MEVSHKNEVMASLAVEASGRFIHHRRQPWQIEELALSFGILERELHEHIMALERDLLAAELSRYDVDEEEVEVEGTVYRQAQTSTETYSTTAGPATVERHLYRPKGKSTKRICPLEPRVARRSIPNLINRPADLLATVK